jgi:hypothetical protein
MNEVVLYELPAQDRRRAETVWTALEAETGNGGLASGWFWTSTWLDAYGDLVPHVFLVAERGGVPCGITLLTRGVNQKHGPIPVRTIHLGTGGEPADVTVWTEYRRLLVRDEDREDVSRAILRHVLESDRSWEEFVFDGFVPEDAEPFLENPGYWFVRREVCPTSDFSRIRAAGGDVIASLGKNTRYSIRRSMRRFGDLTLEVVTTPAQAQDIFDDLIDLHQKHWTARGLPGAFSTQRYVAFHRSLLSGLLERNALVLARVRNTEQTIGCVYGFVEHNRMLMYQTGFADFEDDKLKPGLVSHAMVMQHCLDAGMDEYDFLYGDVRYKRDLSNTTRELVYAVLSKRTLKQALLRRARMRHYRESHISFGSSKG